MEIIQSILPVSACVRPGIKRVVKYIVIHDTDNTDKGANAKAHDGYLMYLSRQDDKNVSWHYTVDDRMAIQHVPDDEVAWHSGDWSLRGLNGGNGAGIGIEMCVNKDGDFEQTFQNTAELTAQLLGKHHLTVSALRQHNDFSTNGKNCPRRIRQTKRWDEFINLVAQKCGSEAGPAPDPQVPAQAAVGSRVRLAGAPLYYTSYGGKAVRTISGVYTVSRIIENREAGVLLNKDLGWVKIQDVTVE